MAKGSSSQQSSSSTATSVTDQRVGVADQGVYAGAGAEVTQGNDFRTFDDHSSFSVQANDSRQFTTVDSRQFVDQSVTNVTTLDGEVAREAIAATAATAKSATEQNTKLLESALDFGEAVTGDAFKTQNQVVEQGFSAVTTASQSAIGFAAGALKTAVDAVTKSADADRAFASEFTGRIFDTAKSADQANVEKIIKAVTVIIGLLAAAWAGKAIFGRSNA